MNRKCKNQNCKGIENYCVDSDPKVDKVEFHMRIQREMGFLSREMKKPVVSEELQEFLRYPKSVTSLRVCGEVEFRVLVSNLTRSQLTTLYLGNNGIGDEGAKALASALPASELTKLGFWGNAIDDEGAEALASALPSSQITKLYLWKNGIGDEGVKALAIALPSSQLTKLSLDE